jgi:hypothetical protein
LSTYQLIINQSADCQHIIDINCDSTGAIEVCRRGRDWDALKGQIYLGSDEFIERHSAEDKELKEIPRAQLKAIKPTLERWGNRDRPGVPGTWVLAARDRRALGNPLRDGGRKLKKIERRT